jgi:heme/copper-type cytochrome/quinol oxidase subunit 2
VHGVYHLIVFLVKWGIVVAVLAALVIVGLRYRKKRDAKRF